MTEFSEIQKELLEQIAQAEDMVSARTLCSHFLQRTRSMSITYINPQNMEELLFALLSGAEGSAEQFRALSGGAYVEYSLLVIAGEPTDQETARQELCRRGDCWCVSYAGRLVCLNGHTTAGPEDGTLEMLLNRCRLCAGASRPFRRPSLLRLSYEQALDTLKKALVLGRTGKIALYDDYLMLHLFDCLRETVDLDNFSLPDIKKLREFDQRHSGELCRTLLCYLQHSKNVGSTARELNIHRNTVHYRINKCIDILSDLNFEDDYMTFLLLLSLHIAEYDDYRRKRAEAQAVV